MSRGGSNRTVVSAMLLGSTNPAYAPDGGVIAFEGSNGGSFQIYSMDPTERTRRAHSRTFPPTARTRRGGPMAGSSRFCPRWAP